MMAGRRFRGVQVVRESGDPSVGIFSPAFVAWPVFADDKDGPWCEWTADGIVQWEDLAGELPAYIPERWESRQDELCAEEGE
jgi:hypothetical protein